MPRQDSLIATVRAGQEVITTVLYTYLHDADIANLTLIEPAPGYTDDYLVILRGRTGFVPRAMLSNHLNW